MAWVIPLVVLFLALPFIVERVQSPRWRALLNVGGALLGGWIVVLLAFIAAFAQALFGRILSLSAAGVMGLLCLAGLTVESLSWVGTDIATAWRGRRGGTRGLQPVSAEPVSPESVSPESVSEEPAPEEHASASELVGEEGVQPGAGGAVEDEG